MLILWSLLAAVIGIAVAVGAAALLGRTERSKSGSYNPQALSVIGSALLSSFVLVTAFLIAGSWSTYNTDRQHAYDEARSTTVAYWLAGKLPAPDAQHVRDGLTGYVDGVITAEWPLMAHHSTSPAAWSEVDGLRAYVAGLHPANAAAAKAQADVSASLDDVYAKRAVRTADAGFTMPGILYAALVVGAILLIAFPPLVGMTANARNVTLLAGFGVMIGLGISIVVYLSHPYSLPLRIQPAAFQAALQRFGQITGGSAVLAAR